jgi:hypothetical protein
MRLEGRKAHMLGGRRSDRLRSWQWVCRIRLRVTDRIHDQRCSCGRPTTKMAADFDQRGDTKSSIRVGPSHNNTVTAAR